jgi:hypothetical protein
MGVISSSASWNVSSPALALDAADSEPVLYRSKLEREKNSLISAKYMFSISNES